MRPLEAIPCGVPVIVSSLTALPEIVGGGGASVDQISTAALTLALSATLNNAHLRSRLVQICLEGSRNCSWLESAKRVREQYLVQLKAQQ
jgi:glycosyltransferase involved in cell wall biosynthesis